MRNEEDDTGSAITNTVNATVIEAGEAPAAEMSAYERRVLRDIARHRVEPGPVRRVLEVMGKPVDKLVKWAGSSDSAMVRSVHDSVMKSVNKSLMATVRAALATQDDGAIAGRFRKRGHPIDGIEGVRGLPLMDMDAIAESYRGENSMLIGVEGAALGALATMGTVIPYAQITIPAIVAADIAASMTLLSRTATMVSSCYGYPVKNPENLAHVLVALAPTQYDTDDGFMAVKGAAVAELRAAGEFMRAVATRTAAGAAAGAAAKSGSQAAEKALEEAIAQKAPKLLRIINTVASRLGIVLTEKELGTLLPVAGAVVNGGLNVAFHHVGHNMAMDYFREQVLGERYGASLVRRQISEAEAELRSRGS